VYPVKIHKARLQRIIKEELVRALREAVVPQLYKGKAGLSSIGKIKTSEVDFEWGDYDGRHSDEVYWVSNETGGKLGSVQTPGDPYTYESRGERLIVVSAPEHSKKKIGVVIDRPQKGQAAASVDREPLRFEDEEIIGNPCGALTKSDIIDRLKPWTLEEIMYKYSTNRNYIHTVFARGGLLGPVSDDLGYPSWNFSSMTLKELFDNENMIVQAYDEMYESGEYKVNGKDTWKDMISDPTYGLGLGFIVKMIMDGDKPCPPSR